MGQVLHSSARTTEAVRRAIQNSQASVRALAKRYGVIPKTVAKWKHRTDVKDEPMGTRQPRSSVLTVEEEAIIVAFRRHTMNRTRKEATVYRYWYANDQQLEDHPQTFLAAYTYGKRLKALKGLTPFEFICSQWQIHPDLFTSDPSHLTLGLYT